MKTVRIKIYKFKELTEEAKKKAIENLYDINLSYDWWDITYDDAKEIGLKLDSFDLDRNRHATGEFYSSARECAQSILDNHGDICETYKTAEAFLKERDELIDNAARDENGDFEDEYELDSDLDDLEAEFLKSILEDYSIILQKESEYLSSEDAIIESIEANDYDFTKDGKIY